MSANTSADLFVNLNHYSGPLDMLLQLIRKKEMDIFAIDISQITDQYVAHLNQIAEPDLDKAGDFIRLASWLIYIKSRSLLPPEEQAEEESDLQELKNKLSSLLRVYQCFQNLGKELYERNLLGRDAWSRPCSLELKAPLAEQKIEIDQEKGLSQLSQAYYKKLSSYENKEDYKILKPVPSVLSRLKQTVSFFQVGLRLKFHQLAGINKSSYSFLLSFLSILELSKAGFITLFQKSLFSNIDILVRKPITSEALDEIQFEEPASLQ